ncbi:unnamed protein product [Diamesa hyperborea]
MDFDPRPIVKLDEGVINKIAAGEIIQRPANALKELIENSLDAKSKSIQITCKLGGLKYLQISDNGTGILKDNLTLICERFTTSKLTTYSDLQQISTYGFRGEALASISMIARLTIQTKTRNDVCAYRAQYENGNLMDEPKACAGNQGTQIIIEDLFYNVPIKLKALKIPSDEFQRIFDVVARYAVHNYTVSFCLKKYGENNSIKTQPSTSAIDNIRTIYGNVVANSLLPFEYEATDLKFKVNGLMTNANHNSKKMQFLLFINHRLVESKSLKKAIDDVYSPVLPRGSFPFVYLSLEIDPNNVDVNVSPTKLEVNFLHEDLIVEKIRDVIEEKLLATTETKKLYTQSLLPGAPEVSQKIVDKLDRSYDKDMVRTDFKNQSIIKFFGNPSQEMETSISQLSKNGSSQGYSSQSSSSSLDEGSLLQASSKTSNISNNFDSITIDDDPKEETIVEDEAEELTSVLKLKEEFENKCDEELKEMMNKLILVGVVNTKQCAVQADTKLFLCNTRKMCEELFYQLMITNFSNLDMIELEKPLSIKSLALIGFETKECNWTEEDGCKEELSDGVVSVLMDNRDMLAEYFSLKINNAGEILTMPQLLDEHAPAMSRLPLYIIRIATEVNYDDEDECFKSFCRETANYYATMSIIPGDGDTDGDWLMEHVLLPEIRQSLLPPSTFLTDGTILQLTSLPELYKVFERC